MKNSNLALRISLGFALFAFLLPFYQVSVAFVGAQFLSGLGAAFGGQDPFGGNRAPLPPVFLSLLLLVVAFAFSLRRKPLGRWIGILPLIALFFLAQSFVGVENFMASVQPRWGLLFATLCSLVAAVFGFIGRTPASGASSAQTNSAKTHDSERVE